MYDREIPILVWPKLSALKMCWSASVSLNTFLFSTFAACLALGNGVVGPMNFAFIMSFVSIQLVEYFIWSKTFSNSALSKAALVLILLQPALSIVNIGDSNADYRLPLLAAYGVFLLTLFTVIKPWHAIEFKSEKGSNGHLAWYWLDFGLPLTAVWVAFFLIRYLLNKEYVMFAVISSVVLASVALYHKTHTWGSMWCWVANLAALELIYRVFRKDVCGI